MPTTKTTTMAPTGGCGWELTLIATPPCELDAAILTGLGRLSSEQAVAQVQMPTPRRQRFVRVGDCFRVRRLAETQLRICGDVPFLHGLGADWQGGLLFVDGNVGSAVGRGMKSGTIEVHGDTRCRAGMQMKGGRLHIHGHTGDYLACPTSGARSGMSGGRIVIDGNAGDHAGHRMRRGTLIIKGNTGQALGSDMVAGTIAVTGQVGTYVGNGMRRGTIVLANPTDLSPSRFTPSAAPPDGIAQLLSADFRTDDEGLAELVKSPLKRALGDLSAGGQGEVWMR